MSQNEPTLDATFQEFISTYLSANPEDQARVRSLLQAWMAQQEDVPGTPHRGSRMKPNMEAEPRQWAQGEDGLRKIANNMEQVIWIRDLNSGHVLFVSSAFETVWGRPAESFSLNPNAWIDTIHPEDRVQVLVAAPSSSDRHPIDLEYRILRPDGSVRWIRARTFLLADELGPSSRLVSIAQDITEQKEVELALRKALDRTQEQFALSRKMSLARKPGAVLKTLMSARELRSAKRAALLFFDAPEEEPVHGIESIATWQASQQLEPWEGELTLYEEPTLWELFEPGQPVQILRIAQDDRLAPAVRDLLLRGRITSLVIFPMVALGKRIGVALMYYQEEHHFDSIELRHLKVLVDQATITLYNLQLLEVEEDLRHEAEHANEIKTQFLAMISHELRTPLTSIIGFTTTLLADDVAWEPDEQQDFIRTIRQEANRLQELIDHLLDLSRLEAGMLTISPQPCSLRKIIEETLPQLGALTTGQQLVLHIPTSLPLVQADPKRIAQVMINLVQNALTYAAGTGEITISAAHHNRFVQVNVADQGPGFPPAERKVAFVAFRRGASEDPRPGKGAGLGLAICKRLIEAHGGRIWIKKLVAPGATISFTIPIAPKQPSMVE